MKTYIFKLYHDISKNRARPEVLSRPDSWPEEWKTTYIKTYDRFEKTVLPAPSDDLPLSLGQSIRQRKSTRNYTKSITEQNLADVLFYSCGEIDPEALGGRGRRAYASGGARYPLETYIFVIKPIGAIKPGIYHYDVCAHTLSTIDADGSTPEKVRELFFYPESATASMIVVLTAVFERATIKYKERAYRHILLEAGGAGQQMYLVAAALNIGCVAMSGVVDTRMDESLDLDGVHESVVHTVIFG